MQRNCEIVSQVGPKNFYVDNDQAYRKACGLDFNVGHGGKNDVSHCVKAQPYV